MTVLAHQLNRQMQERLLTSVYILPSAVFYHTRPICAGHHTLFLRSVCQWYRKSKEYGYEKGHGADEWTEHSLKRGVCGVEVFVYYVVSSVFVTYMPSNCVLYNRSPMKNAQPWRLLAIWHWMRRLTEDLENAIEQELRSRSFDPSTATLSLGWKWGTGMGHWICRWNNKQRCILKWRNSQGLSKTSADS